VSAIFIGKRMQKLSRASQDALADSGALAEESLSSMRTVRAFGRERGEAGRYGEAVDRSYLLARRRSVRLSSFVAVSYFASFAVVALGLWLGFRLKQAGEITGGDLLAFVLYGATAGFGISGLGEIWGELMKVRGAGQRVFELLDRETAMPMGSAAPEGEARPVGVVVREVRGGVELRGVTFRYPTRPDVAALDDVSLTIKPGEIVALVGPSGAGKSTIAALLPRLLRSRRRRGAAGRHGPAQHRPRRAAQPHRHGRAGAGALRHVDRREHPLRQALRHRRRGRGRLARRARARVRRALARTLRDAGRRARRAALRRPEAARGHRARDPARPCGADPGRGHVGSSTRRARRWFARRSRSCRKGRTCVVIAHRLSTVRDADRVVVMDRGRVVQQGRHAELVADETGLYAQLVQRQLAAV